MTDTSIQIKLLNPITGPDRVYNNDRIAEFLFNHLEKYGDPKEDILKCLDYVFGKDNKPGGFILLAIENEEIVGAVVINETGMSKYIPENILVYIAVDASQRGKGVGKELMESAIKIAKGDIALHVEPDNPAKFLYEKLGFTSKYLEMRLKR
jgi:[ribosomal protein S18]-alanine N-acetyltransferase